MTYEPQAGSSQNVYEFVFIKTEHPDYLEEVTFIDENNAIDEDEDDDGDDIIDLTECEDEDDVIYICDWKQKKKYNIEYMLTIILMITDLEKTLSVFRV